MARIDRLVQAKAQFLGFLERRLGRRADAEDLLQTAYLRLLEQGDTVRDEDRLVPWFYQVLRNLLVDHYRRRGAGVRAEGRLLAEAPTEEVPGEELFRATCACVNDLLPTLPSRSAEMIRRVELDGQPVQQVARDLGITANNASVSLHRARRALRQALRATCGVCTEHGCLDCACRRPAGR